MEGLSIKEKKEKEFMDRTSVVTGGEAGWVEAEEAVGVINGDGKRKEKEKINQKH